MTQLQTRLPPLPSIVTTVDWIVVSFVTTIRGGYFFFGQSQFLQELFPSFLIIESEVVEQKIYKTHWFTLHVDFVNSLTDSTLDLLDEKSNLGKNGFCCRLSVFDTHESFHYYTQRKFFYWLSYNSLLILKFYKHRWRSYRGNKFKKGLFWSPL